MLTNTERSKKKKYNNVYEIKEKFKLWNVFETEVINPDKPTSPLECL